MTVGEKIISLIDGGVSVLRYGEGIICHQVLPFDGTPYLLILGLKKDCRGKEITGKDVVEILEVIPFKDQNTIDAFKYSISQIEDLFAQNKTKTGE